ncbi:MAG: hypothetical protein K8R36_03135 [Planctomycetales bacterium]|nr:hypothetical protein [Planctomycetales bacterium]
MCSVAGAGVACMFLLGCWNSRSYEIDADYGDYSFGRWGDDKRYRAFGLDIKDNNHKPPSIEIMLESGESFNCETITVKGAEKICHDGITFEVAAVDKPIQKIKFKNGPVKIIFCEDKLESVNIQKGGKFRFPDQKEFVTLPISEKEMERLFGKPKKYTRTYGLNP